MKKIIIEFGGNVFEIVFKYEGGEGRGGRGFKKD